MREIPLSNNDNNDLPENVLRHRRVPCRTQFDSILVYKARALDGR